MGLYLKVRHVHFKEGLSGRQVVRNFGISCDGVRKMLAKARGCVYFLIGIVNDD